MCSPIAAAGIMAAVSAGQAFMKSERQRAQTLAQADAARNNALAARQQAHSELQKGELNKRRVDMERDRLRRDYERQAGAKRSLLASGNVDISSGSAADALLGDADLFAEDLAANRHAHALAGWEAGEAARKAAWQADSFDAQASWLGRSAGSLGDSLLSAGIAGGKNLGWLWRK